MKFSKTLPRTMLCCLFVFSLTQGASGQFLKKLGEKAEKAAERTIEKRVEKETTKKTDEALDGILEPDKNEKKNEKEIDVPKPQTNTQGNTDSGSDTQPASETGTTAPNPEKSITVYSKFDYVPGDKLLFFDDFSNDFVGDFPSKWNTNGTGEVVTLNESPDKWFEIKAGHNLSYIPDIPTLPEEYTIEFDFLTVGLDSKTSSTAYLHINIGDKNNFETNRNQVHVQIPLYQSSAIGISVDNRVDGKREINSTISTDIRKQVLQGPHVSIAVNKQRYRLWLNESKYLDIPRVVPVDKGISALKFSVSGLKDGKDRMFLRNLKVAEGGKDLRRTLISEGKVSTNGILFQSGSANIQPQSMGIILQISQVLQQEKDLKLKIVGHTDADGNDQTNLELSKKRAEAVKNTLTSVYSIAPDRLQTDGKGESEPVGDNTTTDGKAQNRRVEFIKI